MTEDKGRLLLRESRKWTRRRKIELLFLPVMLWFPVIFFLYMMIRYPWVFSHLRLTLFLISVPFVSLSLYGVFMAAKAGPLNLHETGIDNFRAGLLKWKFTHLREIETIAIQVFGSQVVIRFYVRNPWMIHVNPLIPEKEDRRMDKLREVVEIMKSKGVRAGFGGKREDLEFLERRQDRRA